VLICSLSGAVANQPSQKAEPLNQEASPHREVVKKGDLQQPLVNIQTFWAKN
jgi:hypothetical protein